MKLDRFENLYLNEAKTKVSAINEYLWCSNGVVELFEYTDMSVYKRKTRLFLCRKIKDRIFNEEVSIVRQTWIEQNQEWVEAEMKFDSNSIIFLHGMLDGTPFVSGGEYSLVRDYRK